MAARPTNIEVLGLDGVIAAARAADKEWGAAVLREIKDAIVPIRNEARDRFEALGGTGPRVAKTVRVSVTGRSTAVVMGDKSVAGFFLGREFGARRRQTRPFQRRVQTGRYLTRQVGGGDKRTFVARIPYSKPSIFGPWTGNQFDLGDTGRLSLEDVSGRAFYPSVGAGLMKVQSALDRVVEQTTANFPGPVASKTAKAPTFKQSPSTRLGQFLAKGGI